MNRTNPRTAAAVGWRRAAIALVAITAFCSTMGLSCSDIPFASGTFRDAAMSEISTGVKGILNGILDGIFAVIEEAGSNGAN